MRLRYVRPAAPFAAVSLLVAIALGAGLAFVLHVRITHRADDAVLRLAETVVDLAVAPSLQAGDLPLPGDPPAPLAAPRAAALTRASAPILGGGQVNRLLLVAPDGTVLWSSDGPGTPRDVGTVDVGRAAVHDLAGGLNALLAHVPIAVPEARGNGQGVVLVEVDNSDALASERRDSWAAAAGVALAMLVMWLLLVRLAERTTGALRRSVEDNERLARTDALTGLPNRLAFTAALDAAVRARRPVAVLILDIDRFKDVNDSFGHLAGDALLRLVAERLTAAASPEVRVARLGGDEFAAVSDGPRAEAAVRAMRAGLDGTALLLGGARIEVGASAGIVVSGEEDVTPSVLLQRADLAMYAAKRRGGDIVTWAPSRVERTAQHLEMLSDLRTALADEEIELYAQPVVSPRTGQVKGAELLVRWNHPEHGLLLPEVFVPLAEQNDLIHTLTTWLVDQAAQVGAAWQADGHDLVLSLNISPRDLRPELPVLISEALTRYGVAAERLCVELTETCLPTSMDAARTTLRAIAGLGVQVAVDDFGTGFATLSWLRELAFRQLKVDRSFVANLEAEEEATALVRHVVGLGHSLGMSVVAEGVETAGQYALLRDLGADLVQGFLVAEPMRLGDFLPWLATYGPRQADGLPVPVGPTGRG